MAWASLCLLLVLLSLVGGQFGVLSAQPVKYTPLHLLRAGFTIVVLIIACIEPFLVLRRLNAKASTEGADIASLRAQARDIASVAVLFAFAMLFIAH